MVLTMKVVAEEDPVVGEEIDLAVEEVAVSKSSMM